jgi:hypothetical protein
MSRQLAEHAVASNTPAKKTVTAAVCDVAEGRKNAAKRISLSVETGGEAVKSRGDAAKATAKRQRSEEGKARMTERPGG